MAKLLAEWFWVDRWMGSSAFGLPVEVRGLYREMLSQAWRREAKLPNDHEQIRRLTATTKSEWRRCWPRIERFWRVDGDCLVNDTQLQVYADAKGRSERAESRARAGAQARHKQQHKQSTGAALGSAYDLPSVSVTVASTDPPPSPSRRRRGVKGSVCPHSPKCETTGACIGRTLTEGRELREKASA